MSNGNLVVKATTDSKLTTFGGLTLGTWQNDGRGNKIYYPNTSQGITHADVYSYMEYGIPATRVVELSKTYITNTERYINKMITDYRLSITQQQFDMLVSIAWNAGTGLYINEETDGSYLFDFVDVLVESGFTTKPSDEQIYRFEHCYGRIISATLNGKVERLTGLWRRRMSELDTYFGRSDYVIRPFTAEHTQKEADAWLTERGEAPTTINK